MRKNIEARLNKVIDQKVVYEEVKELCPKHDKKIKAIIFEGVEYNGKYTQIFAYYGKPKIQGKNCKTPAVLLIHGGLGHAYSQWVHWWNERGYIAIAIEMEGAIPKDVDAGLYGKSELWGRDFLEFLSHRNGTIGMSNDAMGNGDKPLEEQWMYHALNASILAHNILRQDDDVDINRIGVHGISWGGVIISLLVGYDTRFAFAIPVYGSGYLRDGLAPVEKNFYKSNVANLWLAELRFHKVTCPILWIGSNDDNCFSVQPKSLSYSDTVKRNEYTRLAFVDGMLHNHEAGCNPQEILRFANGVIGNDNMLPQLTYKEGKKVFELKILMFENDNKQAPIEKVESITLYYITEKMTYTEFDKFGRGNPKSYMTQVWKKKECEGKENRVKIKIPQEAVGYYVEVRTILDNITYVGTTPYLVVKD